MHLDLIVIGGGPAGYLASECAGRAGLSVLCVERGEVGGVCLNEGCVPTKTLLYSAKLYDGAKYGAKYGVAAEGLRIDHTKVLARKNKVVKLLTAGVRASLRENNVELIAGEGVIRGRSDAGFIVEANGAQHSADKLLIATGSLPAIPPIPGLKEAMESGFALTSREILSLPEAPQSLVVMGGGVIGLELASYFNSIGTKVDVVEMLDHLAGENDAELTSILQKNYERRGMSFHLGARVSEVAVDGVRYEQSGESRFLTADRLLVCIGRRPNTSGLGLETLGVATERGAIVTDEYMRTNVEGVYAAGDVNGISMLAHTAYREAEVALNHMLGIEDAMRYDAVPAVLYTNPELASVGETEATAAKKGLDTITVKLPMRFSGRYMAENEGGDGLLKLVALRDTKRLVGLQALANHASEFIAIAGVFIERGFSLGEMKRVVFPHPTVAEAIREAIWQIPD